MALALPILGDTIPLDCALYEQVKSKSDVCDVIITCGTSTLRVHWCVLLTCPYFKALYHSGLRERKTNLVKLHLPEYGLHEAIRFLYIGSCDLDHDIDSILKAADYLQISNLLAACERYLEEVLITNTNSVQFYTLTVIYRMKNLQKRYKVYILDNITDILAEESTLQLNIQTIIELVKMEEIRYVPHDVLFNFITIWTAHDAPQRSLHFPRLFAFLNLRYLSEIFMKNVVKPTTFVISSSECMNRIREFEENLKLGFIKLEPQVKNTVMFSIEDFNFRQILMHDLDDSSTVCLNSLSSDTFHQGCLGTVTSENLYIIQNRYLDDSQKHVHLLIYNMKMGKATSRKMRLPYYTQTSEYKRIQFIEVNKENLLYVGMTYQQSESCKFAIFSFALNDTYDSMLMESELCELDSEIVAVKTYTVKTSMAVFITLQEKHSGKFTINTYVYETHSRSISRKYLNRWYICVPQIFLYDNTCLLLDWTSGKIMQYTENSGQWQNFDEFSLPPVILTSEMEDVVECLYSDSWFFVLTLEKLNKCSLRVYSTRMNDLIWQSKIVYESFEHTYSLAVQTMSSLTFERLKHNEKMHNL